jgi:YD repeat-containing protein
MELKTRAPLRLRVPAWAPADSLTLMVNNTMQPIRRVGSYLPIDSALCEQAGTVELSYDLPRRLTEERMPDGKVLRFTWVGDTVQKMEQSP